MHGQNINQNPRFADFGDGSTSTLTNPNHKYARAGNYTVALTVMNSAGTDIATKTDYITVGGPDSTMARQSRMRAQMIAENATADAAMKTM